MAFAENVFINCPFDAEYRELLHPLLFTVVFMGLEPQIALQSTDSGKPRFDKLVALIRKSRFAIHDLSRLQAQKKGEYFRLNMPFELGLDVGARKFGRSPLTTKRCLILESQPYRYQAALSDLSNSDIAVHRDRPRDVATQVRNWLHQQTSTPICGPSQLWRAFNNCMAATQAQLLKDGYSLKDVESLPVAELIRHVKSWTSQNQ